MKKKPVLFPRFFIYRNSLLFLEGLVLMKDLSFSLEDLKSPKNSFLALKQKNFSLKIEIFKKKELLSEEFFMTSSEGFFSLKIPCPDSCDLLKLYYEEKKEWLLLEEIKPIVIHPKSSLVISDFDQTLIQTQYRKIKEIYQALQKPLQQFSTIESSLELLKTYSSYHSFVLSASPYFFYDLIKEWLIEKNITFEGILLKDIRHVLSLKEELSFKDVKNQIYYKVSSIFQLLLSFGLPKNLVLIGDSFESDLLIYSIVKETISFEKDVSFLSEKIFQEVSLTTKQKSDLLEKIHLLYMLKKPKDQTIEIFIRGGIPTKIQSSFLTNLHEIIFYS